MTKSLPKIITMLMLTCLIVSCKGEGHDADCVGCGENLIYGTQKSGGAVEEVVPAVIVEEAVSTDEEFAENKIKIEKKYGEQWDFCHCIKVNDSLNKAVNSGAEIGDDFMKRFDEVELKCQAFRVTSPDQTPEERAAHEKRVRNCLRR